MLRRGALLVSPVVLIAFALSTIGSAQARSGDPGSTTRVIAPGQSHAYRIALEQGDWLRADVAQDDVDIVATLTAPDGHDILSVNASNDELFPETIVAVAEQRGTYTIGVRPVASTRVPGRYSIHIAPARPATDADRHVVEAERAFAAGARLLDPSRATAWPEALAHFRSMRQAYVEAGDPRGEMKAVYEIARTEYHLDDPDALQSARDGEQMARALGDRLITAAMLDLTGRILEYRAEFAAALAPFADGIAITRALGDRQAELRNLNGAAFAYDRLGNAERAAEMLTRALDLARQTHDADSEGNILNNLGITYRELGEYDRALDWYERALANRRAASDLRGEMFTLDNIGNLKIAAGTPKDALAFHQQALALARRIGSKEQQARAVGNLGNTELQLGDVNRALAHEQEALALRDAIGDVSGQADTLERIGVMLQRLHRLDEADAALERSLAIRRRIGEQYNEAATLFDLGRLEHDRGGYAKAIEYARAATTLDEELRRRIASPDLRATFRAQGESYYELLIDLLQQHAPGDAAAAAFDVSERARARVLLESVVDSRIDRSGYAALPQAEPLASADIQRRVVDQDTVLLEFALGEERSWLWAVTPTELITLELPRRKVIDAAARRVYEEMSARSPRATHDAVALSRMLFGGLADRLRGRWHDKRLAIVPSGSLGYVPFAALPLPYGSGAIPLSARHEIVMAPSASVIAALRDEAARRRRAPRAIAIVADPVFDDADPRVVTGRPRSIAAVTRGAAPMPRLAFSGAEADAIASLAPSTSVLKETGFQATRASVLHGALDDYRIVHFATHGVIDDNRPAMSALVLSLVDRTGAPLDGYLRQRDIYTMRLDADLVVLSACQTAVGREVRGEGLMGLTRAFMYAGTPRVVASLWEVGDRATAEFMTIFYQALLQRHLRPAAALREAQIAMARNPRWSSPYYWAGFVLHGDWR